MLDTVYELNRPDVVTEAFDGEFVVLDLSSGVYFAFQGSGNAIWQALESGVRPRALLDALRAAGNAHHDAVLAFIEALVAAQLIRPAGDQAAAAALLPSIDLAPVLERFDDLAELILADPIHDADADRGWPLMAGAK
ncbi:MAG: PqqD family protein [Micropepsaceae bacterium]